MAQMLRALAALTRGPGFNSQHSHGGSLLSVTPVPGLLMPSHRHTCTENINAHKI